MESQIEFLLRKYVVHVAAVLIVLLIIAIGRDTIRSVASAIKFSFGKTYNTDDWVKIKGEVARIKHIGLLRTSFFMVEDSSIMYIANDKIEGLSLRKAPKGNPFELQKLSSWYNGLDKKTLDKMIRAYKKENENS